jgi:hypothetical protein
MNRTRLFVLLAALALLGPLCIGSTSWAQYTQPNTQPNAQSGFLGGTGAVERCSLSGVNPAYHPEVFGNPAVAKSYGFVQSNDGSWHVAPGCRRR